MVVVAFDRTAMNPTPLRDNQLNRYHAMREFATSATCTVVP